MRLAILFRVFLICGSKGFACKDEVGERQGSIESVDLFQGSGAVQGSGAEMA